MIHTSDKKDGPVFNDDRRKCRLFVRHWFYYCPCVIFNRILFTMIQELTISQASKNINIFLFVIISNSKVLSALVHIFFCNDCLVFKAVFVCLFLIIDVYSSDYKGLVLINCYCPTIFGQCSYQFVNMVYCLFLLNYIIEKCTFRTFFKIINNPFFNKWEDFLPPHRHWNNVVIHYLWQCLNLNLFRWL